MRTFLFVILAGLALPAAAAPVQPAPAQTKIDPATLPRAANIHYLGMKPYGELPSYFSSWEIGLLPFALNESTRFISPTKTPEYLAAGLRVISTPITDVISPYQELGLVEIGQAAGDFVRSAEKLLSSPNDSEFESRADSFLSQSSWNETWGGMDCLIERCIRAKRPVKGDRLEREVLVGGTHV